MIINKAGAEFIYDGMRYRIGETIVGTAESEYEGLYGTITEIRDGEDKETENDTPDIYCSFDPPVLPYDIAQLEKRFSELYRYPKKLEDLILDFVIMAPEMVMPMRYMQSNQKKIPVYIVYEDWAADAEGGYDITLFSDYREAKHEFNRNLAEDMRCGCSASWCSQKNFMQEVKGDYYECWLDGDYGENHFKITLCKGSLVMSSTDFGKIGRAYMDEGYREDFLSQMEEMPEVSVLTDEQCEELLRDPGIAERIQSALGKNDRYWECYWETISQVIQERIKEYHQEEEADCFMLIPDDTHLSFEDDAEDVPGACIPHTGMETGEVIPQEDMQSPIIFKDSVSNVLEERWIACYMLYDWNFYHAQFAFQNNECDRYEQVCKELGVGFVMFPDMVETVTKLYNKVLLEDVEGFIRKHMEIRECSRFEVELEMAEALAELLKPRYLQGGKNG